MSAAAAETPSEQSSRERILDAAESLFARRGYAGVGLRELAEMVGLGKSSLFHHFASKPQLHAAVCARILSRIADRVDEIAGTVLGWDVAGRGERVASYLAAARHEHDLPSPEARG